MGTTHDTVLVELQSSADESSAPISESQTLGWYEGRSLMSARLIKLAVYVEGLILVSMAILRIHICMICRYGDGHGDWGESKVV